MLVRNKTKEFSSQDVVPCLRDSSENLSFCSVEYELCEEGEGYQRVTLSLENSSRIRFVCVCVCVLSIDLCVYYCVSVGVGRDKQNK